MRNVRPIISASRRGTDDAKSTNHDAPGDMAKRITSDIKEEVGKDKVERGRKKKRKEEKVKAGSVAIEAARWWFEMRVCVFQSGTCPGTCIRAAGGRSTPAPAKVPVPRALRLAL